MRNVPMMQEYDLVDRVECDKKDRLMFAIGLRQCVLGCKPSGFSVGAVWFDAEHMNTRLRKV